MLPYLPWRNNLYDSITLPAVTEQFLHGQNICLCTCIITVQFEILFCFSNWGHDIQYHSSQSTHATSVICTRTDKLEGHLTSHYIYFVSQYCRATLCRQSNVHSPWKSCFCDIHGDAPRLEVHIAWLGERTLDSGHRLTTTRRKHLKMAAAPVGHQ